MTVRAGSELIWNEQAGIWTGNGPLRVPVRGLIVVAHPDDLESQAGGAVTEMTRAGSEIHLVCCTSGNKGSNDRSMTSERLAAIREQEQRDAAAFLGIQTVEFLGWPDGEVEPGKVLRESIVRRIRTHRPDVVITHDPIHAWPPYTAHRDHRNAGRTTLDALYPDARDHLSFPEHLSEGLEPHKTTEAWLIMSSQPDWYVDIEATIEDKIASRLLHLSQTGNEEELRERYLERATEVGSPWGLRYAEAFKRVLFS